MFCLGRITGGRGEGDRMQGSVFSQGRKKAKHCYFPRYFAIEVLHKDARATGELKGHEPGVIGMGSRKFGLPCHPRPSPPPVCRVESPT